MPLAAEQPAPDAAALPLPLTLSRKLGWPALLISAAPYSVFYALLLVAFGVLHLRVVHRPSPFVSLLLTLLLYLPALLFGIVMAVFTSRISRQRLTVSDEGIETRSFGRSSRVRWRDARLFALLSRGRGGGGIYELSGPEGIVRWVVPSPRARALARTTPPFPAYERSMTALLSVVAGKTGLPLYDLRPRRSPRRRPTLRA